MASSKSPIAIAPALIGAAVIIPTVVYLSYLISEGGDTKGKGEGQTITMIANHGDPSISSVPEANTGIVLVPFIGAVLAFSSLRLRSGGRCCRPLQG
jgi:hypothetical protein